MRLLAAGLVFAFSQPAAAQPKLEIWHHLAVGDTPEEVSQKLLSENEIKSVKVKRVSRTGDVHLDIKYTGYGIQVLDQTFQVTPVFEKGVLQRVTLQTQSVCANYARQQFRQFALILSQKYPETPVKFGVSDEQQVSDAYANGTDEHPAIAGRVFRGNGVTVMYRQSFTRAVWPLPAYVAPRAAPLAGALLGYYGDEARACEGTGIHRMVHSIDYLANEDFDAVSNRLMDVRAAEISAARNAL
ncbi:hypothetical protein [Novosphingobium sp.]|uniref:hypothetical protein n=1 Tax=Novosphingobium sp. TaxID=1874826 RepID=UPI002FDD4A1E